MTHVDLAVLLAFASVWVYGQLLLAYRRSLIRLIKLRLNICRNSAIGYLHSLDQAAMGTSNEILFDQQVGFLIEMPWHKRVLFNWGTRLEVIYFLHDARSRMRVAKNPPPGYEPLAMREQFRQEIESRYDLLVVALDRLKFRLIA